MLNNELEKQHDIVRRVFLKHGNLVGGLACGNGEAILVMSLKRELDAALKEVAEKEAEINNLKKCFKVTKFKEI